MGAIGYPSLLAHYVLRQPAPTARSATGRHASFRKQTIRRRRAAPAGALALWRRGRSKGETTAPTRCPNELVCTRGLWPWLGAGRQSTHPRGLQQADR